MLKNISKKRKTLIILIIIILIGGYIGLSNKKGNDNSIKIAVLGEPSSLDINLIDGGAWEYTILQDSFTGLFGKDVNGKVVPELAEKYSVSKDGLVYTFHLRASKWSDGVPVTAGDFEYSYKKLLDPKTPSHVAYKIFDIKNALKYKEGKVKAEELGVRAIDDNTLEITLERPVGYFIQTLATLDYAPLPQHVIEKYGKEWSKPEHIVTNGAYKIVEWKPKAYVRAIKNDQYYDAKNVVIDEIFYYTQEDKSAILKRFRSGEIDMAEDFATEQYEWLKENYPNETRVSPSSGIIYLSINLNNDKLKDKRVREALSLAIDRDFIVDRVLKTGEKVSYSFVPRMDGYNIQTVEFEKWTKEQRIAQARNLLKEAGYSEKNPLKIELSYIIDDNDKKIFVAVASMWKSIGVEIETSTREVLAHYQELHNNNFELARARWIGSYEDPAVFLESFYTGAGNNFGQYSNKEYDKLFDEAKATGDQKERYKKYEKIERILVEDHVFIPLYYNINRALINQRVQGWVANPSNRHLIKYLSLKGAGDNK